MDKPTIHFNHTPTEVFDIPQTGFAAVMQEVEDTTSVFDTPGGSVNARPVPGYEGDLYVPFGADNQLPYDLIRLVGGDEVTSQNKLFNVLTCYGAGLQMNDIRTKQPTANPEVLSWMRRQCMPRYLLDQMTDMKYFYFTVCVIILSRDGRRINRLVHKEACYVRLEKADRRGRINHVYYANWQDYQEGLSGVERISLLNQTDPYGDLCRRMAIDPDTHEPTGGTPTRDRKFAILMRFPTAGCQYYPVPYWSAVLRGGSYDEKRLISTGKRAKLRNTTSVKYQIEIERSYWERICMEENITDPVKMQERVKKERENIKRFVCGVENSGKAWISGYYVNPDGHEVRDIRILNIEGQKEGGDWNEDVQAAANTICYADNVHPNLVGAVPGKSQTNNSGSDKRELFVMKQALEIAFHDLLLMPLNVVCWFNGWTDIVPTVPMIQLTTLDKHKDAKRVNPNENNGNGEEE